MPAVRDPNSLLYPVSRSGSRQPLVQYASFDSFAKSRHRTVVVVGILEPLIFLKLTSGPSERGKAR